MQISVIIPVYNAEEYIQKAIETALQQPETGEVILVEDNSSDNSLQICEELERMHAKVKLFRHMDGKNHGAGASRNLGIKNSKYDFIAFLDADDYYLPGRFKVAKKLFERYPDIDGVYEAIGVHFYDEQRKKIWFLKRNHDLTTMKEKLQPEQLFEALVKGGKGSLSPDGIVVKKDLIRKCNYFDEHLRLHQDSNLIIKMAETGKLIPGRLKTPVSMRGVHGHNRIIGENSNEEARCLARETLFYWGLKKKLETIKLAALFHNYLYYLYIISFRKKSSISQGRWKMTRFFFLCFKHPVLLTLSMLQFISVRLQRNNK
jgi:glycosyltransferase involved in cell wall biosynthesis